MQRVEGRCDVEVAEYRRHLGRMKTGMGNALGWWWWWLEQKDRGDRYTPANKSSNQGEMKGEKIADGMRVYPEKMRLWFQSRSNSMIERALRRASCRNVIFYAITEGSDAEDRRRIKDHHDRKNTIALSNFLTPQVLKTDLKLPFKKFSGTWSA